MPDGKRNSIPSEGETEGENCFYNEDSQHEGTLAKKLPLSLNSRGFQNISDRLLRKMVANEVKKTLDAEDNKKLIAHHRPVLHSEIDNESDMVVVGVVLNAKQSQNDEVSKAIDMLRRNGVSCVCFTLKDPTSPNGTKKGENPSLADDIVKTFQEHCIPSSPEPSEGSTPETKVSSPTVSTTSDESAKPLDSRKRKTAQSLDTTDRCTSTTFPVVTIPYDQRHRRAKEGTVGKPDDKAQTSDKSKELGEPAEPYAIPTLSPSPPVLFPQVSVTEDHESSRVEGEVGLKVSIAVDKLAKTADNTAALRRKKRRKRLYPYISRRKSRNKKAKKASSTEQKELLPKLEDATEPTEFSPTDHAPTDTPSVHIYKEKGNASDKLVNAKADPYEFEDSDGDDSHPHDFKISVGSKAQKQRAGGRKSTPQRAAKSTTRPVTPVPPPAVKLQKPAAKGSPRKRLNFSVNRAFSPDITDHENSNPTSREEDNNVLQPADKLSEEKSSPVESCVQSISREVIVDTTLVKPDTDLSLGADTIADDVNLVLPNRQCQSSKHCDEAIRADQPTTSDTQALTRDINEDKIKAKKTVPVDAQEQPSNVQTSEPISKELTAEQKNNSQKEPILLETNDSLQDTPESMQLRRSSFYSSITRNVRTNLEKYLDGRPPDLKTPAKRSKKIKNGFLLHHGDNFPDNPEAPYRLHLATQVLLKLNKRRAKCKPKEDKGKSLLSYLKLQPKRVSRVGKHSKPAESAESSSSKEVSSVFSGDWTVPRKFICNICGQVENEFWDMVMHKGEIHPGIVVTHVELGDSPPDGFRVPPSPRNTSVLATPPACTKCSAVFNSYSDLHRHIFECAGNASLLEDTTTQVVRKKKTKRKRGFKRRISSMPKKNNTNTTTNNKVVAATPTKSAEITKRRYSEVFKCEFCTREFKTEGWLKNHVSLSHSLPISIPLDKLSLPSRASISSSRRFTSQLSKPSKQPSRET